MEIETMYNCGFYTAQTLEEATTDIGYFLHFVTENRQVKTGFMSTCAI